MTKRILVTAIICTFIILSLGTSYAQGWSFGVNGGIAKLVGSGTEFWNPGFSVGSNIFYPVSPDISLGGRIGYVRFTPDETELIKSVSPIAPSIALDISGNATFFEIVPSIRISPSIEENREVNLFAQIGLGFFLMNLDATAKTSAIGLTYYEFIKDSENRLGLSLGGGLTMGRKGSARFEILSLYHITFMENQFLVGERTQYFSVNFGVVFDLGQKSRAKEMDRMKQQPS